MKPGYEPSVASQRSGQLGATANVARPNSAAAASVRRLQRVVSAIGRPTCGLMSRSGARDGRSAAAASNGDHWVSASAYQ